MLLVGILVKVEVAIALIELTLLTAKEIIEMIFPKKRKYLPFWNCHKLQLLYPPESSEGVSPLVHKALEGRVKDSVSHGRSFLVAFPPLSGTPIHLPPYPRFLSQLAIKNSSVSCTETSAFAPSPICTCAMYINTLA